MHENYKKYIINRICFRHYWFPARTHTYIMLVKDLIFIDMTEQSIISVTQR